VAHLVGHVTVGIALTAEIWSDHGPLTHSDRGPLPNAQRFHPAYSRRQETDLTGDVRDN